MTCHKWHKKIFLLDRMFLKKNFGTNKSKRKPSVVGPKNQRVFSHRPWGVLFHGTFAALEWGALCGSPMSRGVTPGGILLGVFGAGRNNWSDYVWKLKNMGSNNKPQIPTCCCYCWIFLKRSADLSIDSTWYEALDYKILPLPMAKISLLWDIRGNSTF